MTTTGTYTTAQVNAAKRVIKNAAKIHPAKPQLHAAWTEDGQQCFMDGFRGFRLAEAMPLEVTWTVHVGKPLDLNLSKYIDAAKESNTWSFNLPTLASVKAHIKAVKAERKAEGVPLDMAIRYDLGDDLPRVNAQYLVDLLEILPDAKKAWLDPHRHLLCPIYVSTGTGDAVLMPVHKKTK